MSEYNVRINVKSDTGYDQLYPKSKSDIIDFDKTNSNLVSTNVEGAIKEINNKINSTNSIANANKTNIGTLKNLTTDSKTNLVGAINEVDSHANTATTTANTNKTNIGTLSSLKTSVKNSIVNAINWLYDNVVRKTSVIDNLDDIVANQANGMVAGAKAVATLNADLEELSSVEVVTLKNGVRLTRCGKLRILQCVNASSPEAGNIVDVPAADVPDTYVMASAAYKGQQRGDYFLSLSPTSKKVGLYYGGDNPQAVTGNYIVGQLVWCI